MLRIKLGDAGVRVAALALATILFLLLPVHAQEPGTSGADSVRVAVFGEPGFPSYLVDDKAALPPPDAIVARLESLGIGAEVVRAQTLEDGSRFNARRYSLLVLPYGNCYPQAALQNLQTFHRENGGFVLTGIPFTHPAILDRGAIDGWDAFPVWGELLHVAPGAGQNGENALLLHGRAGDWVGAGCVHFPVHAGEVLRLSAWFHDQGAKAVGESHLFFRYWNAGGEFIGQSGLTITDTSGWQPFAGTFTVPDKAVAADVSPQIWNDASRAFLVSGLTVVAEGRAVPIQNGTFARAGDHWRDQGDQGDRGKETAQFGPNGVGVGSFAGSDGNAKPYAAAPDDPLEIASLGYAWNQTNKVQWLDPASLPDTDTIIPLVGTRVHPVAALVVHHSADYRGVVDAWMYQGPGGQQDTAGMGQMIVRGVVAALKQQGRLTDTRARDCYAALDRLVGNRAAKTSARKEKTSP